ncbi:MAG: hypothetical protein NZ483_05540 [Verrucomicrobiae bacterium]|nr:hypothetical protein [Verrucomicrobiae bacterium]
MRTAVAIIACLVALVIIIRPLENRISAHRAELQRGGLQITADIRERIGQGMAIGLLAGFRGVVADFLWINNHGYWERYEWIRMYRNMELCTTLQPRAITFWDIGSWHMAWNISYAASIDPANRTRTEALKREREWIEAGRAFLEEGTKHNADRWELFHALGMLHWQKRKDQCAARDAFRQAAAFPNAPSYTLRMYVRRVEMCDGPEAAYRLWKEYWRNGNPEPRNDGIDLRGAIARELRRLEEQLDIPVADRLIRDPPA